MAATHVVQDVAYPLMRPPTGTASQLIDICIDRVDISDPNRPERILINGFVEITLEECKRVL